MPKRGYHHGNLKQALVEAALALIEAKGPSGWTVAEAAKRAEVTPAAVYRHFKGREELLAECALQGHRIFGDLMEHAYANGHPTALKAFEATGRAYLAFARKFPGHYMAMFESGLSMQANADLALAATRSRQILEHAAEKLSEHIPADRRPPATMFSAHIWALSHGVVELFARGNPGAQAPFPPDELLEAGIGIYLRGLGLIKPDS
jgi:AcrR family transcriptional regulator